MTRWEWEGYLQGDSEYGVTLWPEPPVHPLALAMQKKWGGRDEMPKTEKLADALERAGIESRKRYRIIVEEVDFANPQEDE